MGARSVVGAKFHGVRPGGVLGAGDLLLTQQDRLRVAEGNKKGWISVCSVDNDVAVGKGAEEPDCSVKHELGVWECIFFEGCKYAKGRCTALGTRMHHILKSAN